MRKKSFGTKAREKALKVVELIKGRPRHEEEKFYVKFSATQLNAILLIILGITFLFQGIIRYFQAIDQIQFIRPWFIITLFALIMLIFSVLSITIGGIIFPLGLKRKTNIISFLSYFLGFVLFLASLIYLLFVI